MSEKDIKKAEFKEKCYHFFIKNKIKPPGNFSVYSVQQTLLKYGINVLIGFRSNTGCFTTSVYLLCYKKSTTGKLGWEKIFSPFSFKTYDEALQSAIEQVIYHFDLKLHKIYN